MEKSVEGTEGSRTRRIIYGYATPDEEWHYGCLDATFERARDLFHKFGETKHAARLHVIVDDDSMIGWQKHGLEMYEVQLMNHVTRRKRLGQAPNAFAEDCLRRVFEGDLELKDLEAHAWFYWAGEWDPKPDRDYWFYRSLSPDAPTTA